MQAINEYWKELTITRRCLLVVGVITMLPIIVIIVIIAGCSEAFKCITKISF